MMPARKLLRHVLLPLAAPAALVCLYFTPKMVFGCANRGLLALAAVFLSMAAAVPAARKGAAAKRRGANDDANWWLVSTLILLSPLFLLVGPLG